MSPIGLKTYHDQLRTSQNFFQAYGVRPSRKTAFLANLDDVTSVFLHVIDELSFVRLKLRFVQRAKSFGCPTNKHFKLLQSNEIVLGTGGSRLAVDESRGR